jgi:hypothetical protein
MAENRVDPTVAGLFLIAFVTLIFGIAGLQVFNSGSPDILIAGGAFIIPVALIIFVFAYMAGKAGNAFAVALFAFIAVALFGATFMLDLETPGNLGEPLLFVIVAFFFMIFAIVALAIGAPKLLFILLILVALLYLFIGFFVAVANGGNDASGYALVFGLFGILAFLVSAYLAVALATQKAPVF